MYKYSSGTTTLVQTLSGKREKYNKYQSLLLKQILVNYLFLVNTKMLMNLTEYLMHDKTLF